ncbi:GNAT family N-acetyltransferase [Daejeonella lutea]|uniref:Phosphinothricin acetyltransferase n=1 Tax=Daejeonella lutea TaxID=572036 RepID=A0A1T5ANY8_9SPHI|nr:GNAT family N-acetyltransferase [Daejeonella lutea]SKB36646.1 phosphinothricin acetyltransferase [Daejeonella lutea]
MEIIEMTPDHWESVRDIYLQGIATKNATLQTGAPSWEEWDREHLSSLRFVSLIDNVVAGWAALTPVSGRCVYAGVNEVSVYVHEDYRGKGVGAQLLAQLISDSEKQNIWTLQSGIFPENKASIALHEKNGFRTVGYREKIGKMEGTWRDVVLMERRSSIAGQE